MNNKLSKEDLEAKALNLNIHNHCMFLFASMLKRCAMGNYYRQVSPFTFEESSGSAIAFCDGGYKDDYGNLLVIEVKTRIIKESQVNPADAIKKAISQELKDELFNYDFIVPVFMYTANHRAAWSFDDAKVMIYFGTANNRKWTNPRTLHEHYNDVMMSGSISELFDNLNTIQSRCVQLELMQSTPQLKTIEPPPQDASIQQANEVPIISRRNKTKFFFIRYDQYVFHGWEHLISMLRDTGLYTEHNIQTAYIMRSLSRMLSNDFIEIVVKWRGDMIQIDKHQVEIAFTSNAQYSFNDDAKEMLRDSQHILIFAKDKKISSYSASNFKEFNNYLDSLGMDKNP
jgi:hypothetical protein